MNLYWCETVAHDEDWFIVASSAKEAKCKHDAQATFIEQIHKELNPSADHLTHEILRSLGLCFFQKISFVSYNLALLCTRKAEWKLLLIAFLMTNVKRWDKEDPIEQLI